MRLTVIGCGDAFGAGGQLQTSFHVKSDNATFLIDCGVTTLISLNRLGLPPNDIDMVCVSHLHGDHFGGLAWLLIDAQYSSKRERPLIVTGPRGIEERFVRAAEALYPDITKCPRGSPFEFVEYEEQVPLSLNGIAITPYEVKHPSGAPPYALRLGIDGKLLAFTGDTGWTESLIRAAQGADLLISECFQYDVTLPIHLDYKTIDDNYERLGAKRVLLTHMGQAMLAHVDKVDLSRFIIAQDGMTLDL